jgi:putative Holliday junction resolvase
MTFITAFPIARILLSLASNRLSHWQAGIQIPMALLELRELKTALDQGHRLLGLDLGKKTIGLALSDTSLTVATPLKTLKRGKFTTDADTLSALVADFGIGGLIVGLPLNMDGSAGRAAQSARAFTRNFAGRSQIPLAMVDERLSTVAAEKAMLMVDTSRKKRAKTMDKVAAAYILQGALDQLRNL